MWISSTIVSWLNVSLDTVQELKKKVAALEAENSALRIDLQATRINNDWFRVKINDLEATNKALLERAYDIKLPVAQIVRTNPVNNPYKLPEALFEHIDDETAKALGVS
jgi:hypothetical protein